MDEPVSWISRLAKAFWAESSTGHRTGFFYFEIWHDIIFIQTALLLFQIQLPSLLQSILNNITPPPSLTCFRHSDLFLTHCLTTKQLYVIIWSWLYPRGNLLVCSLNFFYVVLFSEFSSKLHISILFVSLDILEMVYSVNECIKITSFIISK